MLMSVSVCTVVLVSVMAPSTMGLDLFTSRYHMDALARQENRLFHFLYAHIHHQQSKLTMLIEKYGQLVGAKPADQSPEQYLGHPVNAFTLIRRLAREWPLILHLMVEQIELPEELLLLPTEKDLQSAVRGLTRLQEVYRLDTKLMASGTVKSASDQHRVNITAVDCYEIGKYWYKQTQFLYASSWFDQALVKISEGDLTVQRQQVMPHLFLARAFLGCHRTYQTAPTNNLMHDVVKEYPNLLLDSELSFDFRQALARNCTWVHNNANELARINYDMSPKLIQAHKDMCLGLGDTPAGLKCYYVHYDNPRLLIAPFKLEELFLDPPILMFHDVISDEEVENMKNSFYGVMEECMTVGGGSKNVYDQYRSCHVGWVEDEWSETSRRITRRVGDMTNMNINSSEHNQVASYGLAGEFRPHHDSLERHTLVADNKEWNNRIGTVMFYLNDVESGGITGFPSIRVSVVPKKGAAILWFNLDSQGDRLDDMLHGGCPVLRGSKWVINKWIREEGQDPETVCPIDGVFPKKYYYLKNNHK